MLSYTAIGRSLSKKYPIVRRRIRVVLGSMIYRVSYNTCQFRCSYCYANYNEGMIDKNHSKHDVNDPAMLGPFGRSDTRCTV